jgi:cytochrome P450
MLDTAVPWVLVICCVCACAVRRWWFVSHGVPVPTGSWPVVGGLPLVIRNSFRINDWLTEQTEAAGGKTWSINVPVIRQLIITDPLNVEHMLKTNFENYEKGAFFRDVFQDFLGEGIFLVDGHKWVQQRKTAARIFSRRQFRECMLGVFTRHSRTLSGVLRQAARADTAAGRTVDLHQLFHGFTLDAFCEIAMARPLGCLQVRTAAVLAGENGC